MSHEIGTRFTCNMHPLLARFMRSTWGPSGADRTQVGPMLAPWTLLAGSVWLCSGVDSCDSPIHGVLSWWRYHQIENFSALLAICEVNPPVTGGFPSGISLTKPSDAELWCFLWYGPEQMAEQTIETPVIWDAIALIMTSLQCLKMFHLDRDNRFIVSVLVK